MLTYADVCSVELNLRPKLAFLVDDLGIPPERVASLLLKFPQVLERLKARLMLC
jgi:hypothetical protein